ncbi:hypothetical protein GCM10009613_53710 [Pseudonocardia kongjuensis]|uniref:Ferredoxin n=1 Tax=Pseudonocardia kongjuensis TaxID=102227 RepID=A0ABN1Y5Y8_9PSEU
MSIGGAAPDRLTPACPAVGRWCEFCGDGDRPRSVVLRETPAGPLCATACASCEAAAQPWTAAAMRFLVLDHRRHVERAARRGTGSTAEPDDPDRHDAS